MNRLLAAALAMLCTTGASAQTASIEGTLEALYGTWEATRDTTTHVETDDGTDLRFTILYRAIEISDGTLADRVVSFRSDDGTLSAYEMRHPVRADGLVLHLSDSSSARLRPVGDRLAATWTQGSETSEVLLDRAVPTAVPEALRGVWTTYVQDDAGVVLDLPVWIDERGLKIGNDAPAPVLRFDDDFLLLASDREVDWEGGEIGTFQVYVVRMSGATLLLGDNYQQLRLVRP